MPKYGDDLLLLCRGLQANGAQIFWDTLYILEIVLFDFTFECINIVR